MFQCLTRWVKFSLGGLLVVPRSDIVLMGMSAFGQTFRSRTRVNALGNYWTEISVTNYTCLCDTFTNFLLTRFQNIFNLSFIFIFSRRFPPKFNLVFSRILQAYVRMLAVLGLWTTLSGFRWICKILGTEVTVFLSREISLGDPQVPRPNIRHFSGNDAIF